MDLIIFAHPDSKGSHNAALLRLVQQRLQSAGRASMVIDLHADGFSPIMPTAEAKSYGKKCDDARVLGYRKLVSQARRLIFIYPVWWYGPPAILKGFFDRVFGAGFAYQFRPLSPLLKPFAPAAKWAARSRLAHPMLHYHTPVIRQLAGKQAVVLNTFGGDEAGYHLFWDMPKKSVDEAILRFCGIQQIRRVNWFNARTDETSLPPEIQKAVEKALA